MIKTIVATERDGFDIRTLSISFDVPSDDFDLIEAVKKAATDYCLTDEGKMVYEGNCNCFNWGDFATYVSNSFCEPYGFKQINSDVSEISVNFDEQLVNESDIFEEE